MGSNFRAFTTSAVDQINGLDASIGVDITSVHGQDDNITRFKHGYDLYHDIQWNISDRDLALFAQIC